MNERREPIGRVLRLARPAARRLILASLLGAASIAAGIGLLATSGWMISRSAEHPSVAALGLAVVGVRFFALSRGVFRYGERLVGHDAALRSLADLRVRVYQRLERLAPSGLSAFRSGDLLARLVADVDAVQDLLIRVVPPFGIGVIVGVATVALMWWLLPAAGAVLALTLLVAAVVVPWLTHALARRSEARQAVVRGELTALVVDLLQGAPDLTVYGATDAQLNRIADADAELGRVASASARTAGIGSGLIALLAGGAVWGAILVGVPAVGSGTLAGVQLAVIVLIPLAAFELVNALPAATQSFERVRRSTARVSAVLDAPLPVVDPVVPTPLPAAPHALRVRGLRARYGNEGRWVLDGIDLDLAPGRRLGIVGPSGAGKSTLAHVLVCFVPYEGSVRLDGVELAGLDGDQVRGVIGLVQQDAHVFDTTLRENLRLARRDATDADLRAVIARVRLQDWVDGLADGFDTAAGVHGTRISGGQRQRLAIARALLADFPILVLDEPGEHLDTATADAVMADLLRATEGRTTLVITHRLVGLDAMDEVLVLDSGRVVQRGHHTDLVAADGLYAQLWQLEQGGSQR